jgi:uncharacterized protein YecT (DUF1311 family)
MRFRLALALIAAAAAICHVEPAAAQYGQYTVPFALGGAIGQMQQLQQQQYMLQQQQNLARQQAGAAWSQPGQPSSQTWFWCEGSRGYYPWVQTCATPWRAVNPAATALPQPSATPPMQPPPTARSEPALKAPDFPAQGDALDDFCKTVTLAGTIALCSDRELRALAIERQKAFDEARSRLSPAQQKALLTDQNGWVKTYPQACGLGSDVPPSLPLAPAIKDCMAQAGRARVAYLKAYGSSEDQQPVQAITAPKATSDADTIANPAKPTRTPLGIPIEKRAILFEAPDLIEVLDKVVPFVRASGYRCNSVSSILPMFFTKGFKLTCNEFSYTYYIQDKGRGFYVTTD